jgi:hypothetical protein
VDPPLCRAVPAGMWHIVLWVRRFSIPRREGARGGNDGMVLAPLPSSFGRVVRCSVDDDAQISIFSILARVRSRFPSLRTLLWITKRKVWDDLFQTGMGENVKRSDVQSTAPLQCNSYEFSPGMMLPRIRINGRPNKYKLTIRAPSAHGILLGAQ